jgi:cobalt-zinc-cadmium resistance protein CzcA
VQAGAGFVQRAGEGLVVRADGLALTTEDLAQAPVATRNGVVVRVADVAEVELSRAPRQVRPAATAMKPCWVPR